MSILKNGNDFLIDRGDLAKEVRIENIPFIQRKLSSSLLDSEVIMQKIEEKALWSKFGL